jgi:hypothetical protein
VWCLSWFTHLFIFSFWYMNISVWFQKHLPWFLVQLLLLKVHIPCFDLELFIFWLCYVQCQKSEEFNFENYLKTLVIKVSKSSFSKLRVRKKSYTKPNLFFAPPKVRLAHWVGLGPFSLGSFNFKQWSCPCSYLLWLASSCIR